jgi:hypothetical protein
MYYGISTIVQFGNLYGLILSILYMAGKLCLLLMTVFSIYLVLFSIYYFCISNKN